MKIGSLCFCLVVLWMLNCPTLGAESKTTVGWLEQILIEPGNFQLVAKIDTGADLTSVDAKIIRKFNQNGIGMIEFTVTNHSGQKIAITKQVVRIAEIKRKRILSVKRPVVRLNICLHNVLRNVEVSLADRTNFDYKMLIGRNFLEGHFLVDSQLVILKQPSCDNFVVEK